MPREKAAFRDTLEALNIMFPDVGMLSREQAARFMGVSPRTVSRHVDFSKFHRITKSDLAWQICR